MASIDKAELEAIARLAQKGIGAIDDFIIKNINNPRASQTDKRILSRILDAFSTDSSSIIKGPTPNTSPSELRNQLTSFLDRQASKAGSGPILLKPKDMPQEARNIGMKAVEDLNYRTGKFAVKDPKQSSINTMTDNVEALADMGGNPNFYYDKYDIHKRMAPSLDPKITAMLSAPFSIGSSPSDELYRLGMFLEDPVRYIPSVGLAGGMPQGKALTILSKQNPTIEDLTTSGDVLKIGSYADNGGDPYNSLRATIDTHAYKLPSGLPHGGESSNLTPAQYKLFEKIYQDVAARRGMLPHEIQSATWDIWRRLMQKNPGAMLVPSHYNAVSLNPIFDLSADARSTAIRRMLEESNSGLLKHYK